MLFQVTVQMAGKMVALLVLAVSLPTWMMGMWMNQMQPLCVEGLERVVA